jgi:hypothetical protein
MPAAIDFAALTCSQQRPPAYPLQLEERGEEKETEADLNQGQQHLGRKAFGQQFSQHFGQHFAVDGNQVMIGCTLRSMYIRG